MSEFGNFVIKALESGEKNVVNVLKYLQCPNPMYPGEINLIWWRLKELHVCVNSDLCRVTLRCLNNCPLQV
jgi:hypothetical protein